MPLYDYRCRECANIWEETHSMTEDASSLELACPECGSHDIHRYLGYTKRIGVKFKGTGFASVDLALDAVGMPKNIQNSPETKKRLKDM